jgi:hypothetical protein
MMNRRMRQLDEGDLAIRTQKGRLLAGLLRDVAIFPVKPPNITTTGCFPWLLISRTISLTLYEKKVLMQVDCHVRKQLRFQKNRCDIGLVLAKDMLDAVVVVPCYGSMPDHEIEREAAVIRSILTKTGMKASQELAKRVDET